MNSSVRIMAAVMPLSLLRRYFKHTVFTVKNHSFLTVCPSGFVRLGIYVRDVNSRSQWQGA